MHDLLGAVIGAGEATRGPRTTASARSAGLHRGSEHNARATRLPPAVNTNPGRFRHTDRNVHRPREQIHGRSRQPVRSSGSTGSLHAGGAITTVTNANDVRTLLR
jgi:hypothetical protein